MTITSLPTWIKFMPSVFYGVAILDLAKNLVPLFVNVAVGRLQSLDTFSIVLSAVIYASGWLAYGVLVKIALSIHDRLDYRVAAIGQGDE
jgi:hypothetical protein